MLFKSPKKERVAIYIDGNNFYNRLKEPEINFPKGVNFNYSEFINFLLGDRELISKRYYIGIVKNFDGKEKSKKMVSSQQKFLSELENQGFSIKRGKIIYDNGKPREKGVDVKIAIDLITGAIDDLYDTAILISSDTDLIPAIKYIKFKDKKLEYVGFSHNPSFGMIKWSTTRRLLLPEDINRFKQF